MTLLVAVLLRDPLIILATIVMGLGSLAVSFFDPGGRRQHAVSRAWAKMLLRIAGVRVQVEGLEKARRGRSYVIAANPQSYMDIPVILACLPLDFRFFAKAGLFRIPFLGTHLRRAGHFPVVRGDPRASLKTLSAGAKAVRDRGLSVLLFPEGGRTREEEDREYKEGAAYAAIKAAVEVLPVGIAGTREVLPMHSIQVRPGVVKFRIGRPLPAEGLKIHDRHELNARIRDSVKELQGAAVKTPVAG